MKSVDRISAPHHHIDTSRLAPRIPNKEPASFRTTFPGNGHLPRHDTTIRRAPSRPCRRVAKVAKPHIIEISSRRSHGPGLRRRQPEHASCILGLRQCQHQCVAPSAFSISCASVRVADNGPGWGVLENYEVVRKIGLSPRPFGFDVVVANIPPPPCRPGKVF